MVESTARLRQLWKNYSCNESAMVIIPFGPDRIRVAPETAPAWEALAAVFLHHGYRIRTIDTDSYNCRNIKGTKEKSLHSFGIALDVNWTTNPWIDHAGTRKARFSSKATQAERADDVRIGAADTDFTEALVRDATAIKSKGGKTVFEWGGHWKTVKDCMHFEIDLGPQDLAEGIETDSVVGWEAFVLSTRQAIETRAREMEMDMAATLPALPGLRDLPDIPDLPPIPDINGIQDIPDIPAIPNISNASHSLLRAGRNGLSSAERFVVNARDGLRLRAGPDTTFDVTRTIAFGSVVTVLTRQGMWAQIDLENDGAADGFAHSSFLVPASAVPAANVAAAPSSPVGAGPDIIDLVTAAKVKSMFPAGTTLTHISNNLPFVLAGLKSRSLVDKPMVLMALATIRAETEGFLPISEGISRFNTAQTPFDLYDAGTIIGRRLGNTRVGDGPMFKGRGYVQLTGRDNYTRIGSQIDQPLVSEPELANDPAIAGVILAQFLKNKERAVRAALAAEDLQTARKLVNGGSHGLDRFVDTYNRGLAVLPG